jgi:hypothetical protein
LASLFLHSFFALARPVDEGESSVSAMQQNTDSEIEAVRKEVEAKAASVQVNEAKAQVQIDVQRRRSMI